MKMKVFTVSRGYVQVGAKVAKKTLKGAGVEIACLKVGEEGRGRELGILPVSGCEPGEKLLFATLGQTKAGKPKLFACNDVTDATDQQCIVVLETPIGFRGGNKHTGDREGTDEHGEPTGFKPFPGQVLSSGVIAQGDAGRMGAGSQHIAIIRKGDVFRTSYSGRLYDAPGSHYYYFDGSTILGCTWEERCQTDLF